MKLQPYIDFWVREIEMDFSCSACVLLLCLSVPLCLFPLFLCLCCQSNRNRQQSFSFRLFLPSVSLCHVFHIWECQCANLLTMCMNDNMSVYSIRESYPIPLVLTTKWFECCTDSGFLFIFDSVRLHFVFFSNVCRS